MSRHIAVVGAGISGLAAAKMLVQEGYSVSVIEKACSSGGRISSCLIDGCILDEGAQYFKPESSNLLNVMLNELDNSELITIENTVNILNNSHQILPPDLSYAKEIRYSYINGNSTLTKLIEDSVPSDRVRYLYNTTVGHIRYTDSKYEVMDNESNPILSADGIVLSIPLPQAADLLSESAIHLPDSLNVLDRVKTLRQADYRKCLTVLLGYRFECTDIDYYALLAGDKSYSLLWLAFEKMKCSHRTPDGMTTLVAQMSPLFSKYSYNESEELIVGRTLIELEAVYDKRFNKPEWARVKRWRYSQPIGYVRFEEANPDECIPEIVICGDGLKKGGGKVHLAWDSGIEAAATISARLK